MRAKRAIRFAVLGAVARYGAGSITTAEIATRAGISHNSAVAALFHWRRWRVLWVRHRGNGTWEVRFDHAVVESLLDTFAIAPGDVGRRMEEHRRSREVVAPWTVPKIPPFGAPQPIETTHVETG